MESKLLQNLLIDIMPKSKPQKDFIGAHALINFNKSQSEIDSFERYKRDHPVALETARLRGCDIDAAFNNMFKSVEYDAALLQEYASDFVLHKAKFEYLQTEYKVVHHADKIFGIADLVCNFKGDFAVFDIKSKGSYKIPCNNAIMDALTQSGIYAHCINSMQDAEDVKVVGAIFAIKDVGVKIYHAAYDDIFKSKIARLVEAAKPKRTFILIGE